MPHAYLHRLEEINKEWKLTALAVVFSERELINFQDELYDRIDKQKFLEVIEKQPGIEVHYSGMERKQAKKFLSRLEK